MCRHGCSDLAVAVAARRNIVKLLGHVLRWQWSSLVRDGPEPQAWDSLWAAVQYRPW